MSSTAYNSGVYNAGVYNLGESLSVDVSLEFDGKKQYLSNLTGQALGIEDQWTVNIWFKPFETVARFDAEGNQLFRPDGKAILHFKGVSHQNEVLIWGDRVENSRDQEFIVVENWNSRALRIRLTRFNFAQKHKEWRMFSCTWNGQNLIGYNNGIKLPDYSETVSGSGNFIMLDPAEASELGRGVNIAAHSSGIAQSLNDPYLVAYSGLMGPVTVWNTALDASQLGEVVSGTFGFAPATNSGTYTSSANLKHHWRLGASESNVGFDYVSSGDINISTDATITGTNIVSDVP